MRLHALGPHVECMVIHAGTHLVPLLTSDEDRPLALAASSCAFSICSASARAANELLLDIVGLVRCTSGRNGRVTRTIVCMCSLYGVDLTTV